MNDYIVHKTIAINAAPVTVWDALTNPEKTKEYFFNCNVFSAWKAGSAIKFKGKLLFIKNIEMSGKILQIVPEKLLQYTLGNNSDEKSWISVVTDELSYGNGITTLSITDNVGSGEGAAERYKKSLKGWDKILSGLKKMIEEK
jgi:uncharacterized protein YndB with AHSA1/START domain